MDRYHDSILGNVGVDLYWGHYVVGICKYKMLYITGDAVECNIKQICQFWVTWVSLYGDTMYLRVHQLQDNLYHRRCRSESYVKERYADISTEFQECHNGCREISKVNSSYCGELLYTGTPCNTK